MRAEQASDGKLSGHERFPINWWYLGFVILIAAAGLGVIGGSITKQFYEDYRQGLPISGGWSWSSVLVVDLACLGLFGALLWRVFCDWQTKFTSEAIVRPGLFGRRIIRWGDVTEVKVFNGVGYHIHSGRRRIVIAPHAYKDPWNVIIEIGERVQAARQV